MVLTESRLRKIIRESIMSFTMAREGNPWLKDSYEIEETIAMAAAQEMADVCELQRDNPRIGASYDYNKYVHPILEKHISQNSDVNPRALVRAIEIKLEEIGNRMDWHDGANAARRVVSAYSAYQNPDFLKAKAYNDIYGS